MKFKFYALQLSLVCVVVFILQIVFSEFTDILILNDKAFPEVWRFLTSIFLHGGLDHLIFNLFALALFGSILEKFIGGRRFLIVFFVSGVFANLISVNFYDSSLGASGAIFGVIGALILVKPTMTVWAFGLPMPIFVAGILWVGADIIGAYGFFIGNPINNTGNIAHLSGMFIGILFGIFYREKIRKKDSHRVFFNERALRNWEDENLKST